jgi:hypothetical protein
MKFPENSRDKRYGDTQMEFTRENVALMKGFDAKKAGDYASKLMKKFNVSWVTYKNKKMVYRTSKKGNHYKLILRATRAKLAQNEKVQKILKQTGNLILIADHKVKPTDPPAWMYYKIWMMLRNRIND